MYEVFFGFKEQPFGNTPDPKFFLLTKTHGAALASLMDGIARKKGFLVLTGDVGTGKSTLCRTLLARLGDGIDVALVLNPDLSETEILAAIVRDFGLPAEGASRAAMMDALYRHLVGNARAGRTAVIVVDDAQNLPLRSLEQVRMISNFETDKEKLVQILLVGQPELDVKLDAPEFRQVAQRVACHPRLEPLTAEGTRAYILHRLACAATPPAGATFTERAIRRVHRATRGYPRSINTLCDRVLAAASLEKRRQIDVDLVLECCRDFKAPGAARRPPTSRRRLAALGAAAACAAALSVLLVARAGRMPETAPGGAEAQAELAVKLETMQRGLAALEQRLAAEREAPSGGASLARQGEALEQDLAAARGDAARLRSLLLQKEGELGALQRSLEEARREAEAPGGPAAGALSALGERETELRQAVDHIQGESQSRAEQIRHLEKALETLKGRLGEAERQRENLSRSLQEKERLLAGSGPDPEGSGRLEELQAENEQLRRAQRLLEGVSSQTIEAQGREIERLNREKEDLVRLRGETGSLLPAAESLTAAAK